MTSFSTTTISTTNTTLFIPKNYESIVLDEWKDIEDRDKKYLNIQNQLIQEFG